MNRLVAVGLLGLIAAGVSAPLSAQRAVATQGFVTENLTPIPNGGRQLNSTRQWQTSTEAKSAQAWKRGGFALPASSRASGGPKVKPPAGTKKDPTGAAGTKRTPPRAAPKPKPASP